MICDNHHNMLKKSSCFPCAVCFNGIDCNSYFCIGCKSLVHKKCCSISHGFKRDPSFRWAHCLGTAQPVDGRKITGPNG